jgi:hypothetical protein
MHKYILCIFSYLDIYLYTFIYPYRNDKTIQNIQRNQSYSKVKKDFMASDMFTIMGLYFFKRFSVMLCYHFFVFFSY